MGCRGWFGKPDEPSLHLACSISLGEPSLGLSCLWIRRMVWETRQVFLHVACSAFLSGGAVPQTPGQGGVHEQFPLNNPPECTVILKYRYMPSVTFGGDFDAGGGLSGPLKGLEWFG